MEAGRRQNVVAVAGFAYGVIGADIHVFEGGGPLYLLAAYAPTPHPPASWMHEMPSRMLNARYEVVKFTGREEELAALNGWSDSGPRLAAQLLHGPGGTGKSRLAVRLAQDLIAKGWKVVVASHTVSSLGPAPGSQDLSTDHAAGLLMMIDYADRWPLSHLSWLFRNALLQQPDLATRILLIARTDHGWDAVSSALDGVLAKRSSHALAPLRDRSGTRERMFVAARDSFAALYGLLDAESIRPSPSLDTSPEMGLTLAVHMAALAAVDARASQRSAPADLLGITGYLLQREREHWTRMYESGRDKLDYATPPSVMRRVVCLASLSGPVSYRDGRTILSALGHDIPVDTLLRDHAMCYPPEGPITDKTLEPLYPDRLAEDFVALAIPGHAARGVSADAWTTTGVKDLLSDAGEKAPAWTGRALTVLHAASRRWPHVKHDCLSPLLLESPWLASAADGATLIDLAYLTDTDIRVLETVSPYVRQEPFIQGIIQYYIGKQLADGGRHRAAVTAHLSAVAAFREAAVGGLVGVALVSLSVSLVREHRFEDAVSALKEAVELRRIGSAADEEKTAGLALALHNLGIALTLTRRYGASTAALAEAVELRRAVLRRTATKGSTDRWRSSLDGDDERDPQEELAESLAALGAALGAQGRFEEGRSALTEATSIQHTLTTQQPDRIPTRLAHILVSFAGLAVQANHPEEAISALLAAVGIFDRQARAHHRSTDPDLADALQLLALACVRHRHELPTAERALAEALDIYRILARQDPSQFANRLLECYAIMADLLEVRGYGHNADALRRRLRLARDE